MSFPGGTSIGPCGAFAPPALFTGTVNIPRGLHKSLKHVLHSTLIGIMCILIGCDGSTFTSPTPPPAPPPEAISPPPRVDAPFSWDTYQGFTAFALGHPEQTEDDIERLYAEARAFGWNTARICAETEFWEGDANYPKKPRDLERLEWILDSVARIPGAQVLLIANCTLKGPAPTARQIEWARQVGLVASGFQNVAIEVVNEFDNCTGRGWGPHCPGKQDLRAMIEASRQVGVHYVTSDDSLCHGPDNSKTYAFRLANIGASPADFHPCRTRSREPWDPDVRFLRRVAQFNGLFVLSETVAWMDYSGECGGLRTCDANRINRMIAACATVPECRFTYHSEALLAGESPTWWPQAQ